MVLHIARTVIFSIAIVFSAIVLGLAANFTAESYEYNYTYVFAGLGNSTAALTMVSLPVLLILDRLRDGAFASMIWVELSWLLVLWVLWLATGADTTPILNSILYDGSCTNYDGYGATCRELQAMVAFSFITWILLMGYSVVLLVMSIIGANRGQSTWTSSVKDADFFGVGAGKATASAPAPAMQQHQHPPVTAPTPATPGHAMV